MLSAYCPCAVRRRFSAFFRHRWAAQRTSRPACPSASTPLRLFPGALGTGGVDLIRPPHRCGPGRSLGRPAPPGIPARRQRAAAMGSRHRRPVSPRRAAPHTAHASQNPDITVLCAHNALLDFSREGRVPGGHHAQWKLVHGRPPPFLAFSSASSMEPTNKKADSGRASCLPSKISRNPRTVSWTGTYRPGMPVNCSAT